MSHKFTVYSLLPIVIFFGTKEFVAVESKCSLNWRPIDVFIKLVFPVADSPIKITLLSSSIFLILFKLFNKIKILF